MSDSKVVFDFLTRGADRSERDFRKVGDSVDNTGDRLRRFGKVSTKTAKIIGTALGGALVVVAGGLAKAAKAAADEQVEMSLLANSLRKNTKATDAQIKSTEDWITATQNATGVADGDLRPALAKLVGATKNTKKAQALLTTALDASAGSGKSLDTIVSALAKGYNGNVGALGRLGVKVQDSTKDSAALERAQIKLKQAQQDYTKAVEDHGRKSDEAKRAADKVTVAQLNLGEATGKTKKSTIDFSEALKRVNAQFSGSAAAAAETTSGKYKILRARFQDLVETIGAKLLPKMNDLLSFINDRLIPALGDLSGWFNEHVRPALRKLTNYINDSFLPALGKFADDVWPSVRDALASMKDDLDSLRHSFDRVRVSSDKTGTSFSVVGVLVKILAAVVKESFHQMTTYIHKFLDPVLALVELIQRLVDLISSIPDKLAGVKGAFNGIPDVIKKHIPKLPSIPGLADGGVVKARPGGTLALLAERGQDEAVVPLKHGRPAGGLGGDVQITQHIASTEPRRAADESARAVKRALWQANVSPA